MKYKKYFRKTSLKQKGDGDFFLDLIKEKKPKTFLEIGVFHGVTARNVCELLKKIHNEDFKYIGVDLFEKNYENETEIIPSINFSNPLKKIEMSKLDYVFLDGGHEYSNVKNDLNYCKEVIKNSGTILCDD